MPKSPKSTRKEPQDPDQTDAPPSRDELGQFYAAYDATLREEAPSELVNQWIAANPKSISFAELILRREEASAALRSRRRELLDSASIFILNRLHWRLKGGRSDEACASDEQMIEVQECADRRAQEISTAWGKFIEGREAEAERAVKSAGGEAPALPAKLGEVLRWITKAPKEMEDGVIQEAYRQFSIIGAAQREISRPAFQNRVADIENWTQRGEPSHFIVTIPGDVRDQRLKEEVARLAAIRTCAMNFTAKTPVPEHIRIEVEKDMADAAAGLVFTDAVRLAWLRETFLPFWEQGEFLKMWEDNPQRRGAKGATEKRERSKWLRFTDAFITQVGVNGITLENARHFKRDGVSDVEGQNFLRVLIEARSQPDPLIFAREKLNAAEWRQPPFDAANTGKARRAKGGRFTRETVDGIKLDDIAISACLSFDRTVIAAQLPESSKTSDAVQ